MIDQSRTTAAEREVLREALQQYYDALRTPAEKPPHPLNVRERSWRRWQAAELIAELGDR